MSVSNLPKNADEFGIRFVGVKLERILVPVDFSACTLETLRYATSLAARFNTVVEVLHVIQPRLSRNEDARTYSGLIDTMKEVARDELKRLVGVLRISEGVDQVSARIREGYARDVIVSEARFSKASLIIMGTRNRSWLSKLLRRNTVRHVIQNSPCPVMVLRTGMINF